MSNVGDSDVFNTTIQRITSVFLERMNTSIQVQMSLFGNMPPISPNNIPERSTNCVASSSGNTTPNVDSNVHCRGANMSSPCSSTSRAEAQTSSEAILPRKQFNVNLDHLQNLLNLNLYKSKIAQILCTSRPTLYRIIRENNLQQRVYIYNSLTNDEIDKIITSSTLQLEHPSADIKHQHPSAGEKVIQGHLRSRSICIQRYKLRESLKRIDMAGISARSLTTIKRRQYFVPSPNYLWHIDGTHKLVRWKLVVHMGVDGFSRLIVYCKCSSNNKAATVLNLFKEAERKYGLPLRVRSDHGGENVAVWQYMYENRLNLDAVLVGSSVHNQRIERLNRDVNTQVINYYYNLFTYMEEQDIIDPENDADIFAIHCLFLPIINRKLSEFMHAWNWHPLSTAQNMSPLQLHTVNLRLFHLQSLNLTRNIDLNDIELPSVSVVDFELPHSLLLDEERNRLNEVISNNYDKTEIQLFKIVATFITDCVTLRLAPSVKFDQELLYVS